MKSFLAFKDFWAVSVKESAEERYTLAVLFKINNTHTLAQSVSRSLSHRKSK